LSISHTYTMSCGTVTDFHLDPTGGRFIPDFALTCSTDSCCSTFLPSGSTSPARSSRSTGREYVVEHVLREAHKICIAMSVTLGIAAVQKSAEDTLIGAELVQKML